THPNFLAGGFTTRFLDETPELFQLPQRQDRATKLLTFIGETIINGSPEVKKNGPKIDRTPAVPPTLRPEETLKPVPGTRDRLHHLGPAGSPRWVLEQKQLLVTDTTSRDAHQSLLATRMRSYDMPQIAPAYGVRHASLFSLEMWGGAT